MPGHTDEHDGPCATAPVFTPELGKLVSDSHRPLTDRFRALFTLRNIVCAESIDAIANCFGDASALFKHECAYCLGQMQDERAVPVLTKVLSDEKQDVMVRHEAGEALGAIGNEDCKAVLQQFLHHERKEIAETCEIALDRIAWKAKKEAVAQGPYLSVDPAPPAAPAPTSVLRAQLLDTTATLFDRYRALFTLRNRGDEESVLAICEGLKDESALFRHEMGYVLGQMQHPASIPALTVCLRNSAENPMVRHECAEALGSIATPEVNTILQGYLNDTEAVVKESCIVALDISEYETSGAFQYANGIDQLKQ